MAITLTNVKSGATTDGFFFVEADVAFGAGYPTGGEPVSLDRISLPNEVRQVWVAVDSEQSTVAHAVRADISLTGTPKLLVFTDGSQAANDSNPNASARVRFVGR